MPLTESPAEGRLVDIGDTRLFVIEKSEEGYPLVCLHGGPGRDHWEFADYLDGLGPEVRVILADQRGHGMSDPAPLEELTVERLAADVPALANALDLDEYALLGHSFGGLVALTVALAGGPSRVVLSCTAASVRHHRRMETPYSSFDDVIRWQFRDGDSELANTYLRRRAPEVLKSEIFMHMVGTAFGGFDVESRLGEIPMPALVLAGRHDRAIPVEAAELIAREIPDAQLVVFEQSAHIPFVEEQDAYVDAVKRFVGRSGETTS